VCFIRFFPAGRGCLSHLPEEQIKQRKSPSGGFDFLGREKLLHQIKKFLQEVFSKM
jgi:hypothetical protein